MIRAAAALVCAAMLVAGAAAAGERETAEREGRRRFERGEQHFQRGQYPAALAEYEAGYRVTRLPGFLINMAQCYRLTGDLRRARAYYRKYLVVMPTSPRKAEVEGLIRSLDKELDGEADAGRTPRIPSARWWLWTALASSVVGSTVANMAVASDDETAKR